VFEKILSLIPHETFTFAKVWIIYANFLVRGLVLQRARKVFGMALGKCPRPKIFKAYAELELNLGEMDRCRTIYEKFVSTFGANTSAWIEYG
jgi:crooked neck